MSAGEAARPDNRRTAAILGFHLTWLLRDGVQENICKAHLARQSRQLSMTDQMSAYVGRKYGIRVAEPRERIESCKLIESFVGAARRGLVAAEGVNKTLWGWGGCTLRVNPGEMHQKTEASQICNTQGERNPWPAHRTPSNPLPGKQTLQPG